MPYIKKSPIQEKLWELANEVPGAKYVLPDPYEATSYLMPVGGLTKLGASKEVIDKLFSGASYKTVGSAPVPIASSYGYLRDELANLLRVIGATPKKAIEHVRELKLIPGKTAGGTYHPEAIRVFSSDTFPGSMAETFAHEAGHGATVPMIGKIKSRRLRTPPAQRADPAYLSLQGYDSNIDEYEGAAEYIGQHLQKKAGLTPEKIHFGYGSGQASVFDELSKMPSKNPYMNVYRYFQKLIGK